MASTSSKKKKPKVPAKPKPVISAEAFIAKYEKDPTWLLCNLSPLLREHGALERIADVLDAVAEFHHDDDGEIDLLESVAWDCANRLREEQKKGWETTQKVYVLLSNAKKADVKGGAA